MMTGIAVDVTGVGSDASSGVDAASSWWLYGAVLLPT